MIPQKIKDEIDKYKSRIPTDDELTKLFDLVNSAKLKGAQQVEACDYLQKILDEAPVNMEKEQQKALEQKKEKEARERRIQQAKLDAERQEELHFRYNCSTFLCSLTIGMFILSPFAAWVNPTAHLPKFIIFLIGIACLIGVRKYFIPKFESCEPDDDNFIYLGIGCGFFLFLIYVFVVNPFFSMLAGIW